MQEMTLKQRVAMDDTTPDLTPVDDDEDDDLLSTYDAARRTALARRRKWRYGCGCALLTAVLSNLTLLPLLWHQRAGRRP